MDNRGYGESDKPKSQSFYSVDKLADDVANLAKHLGRDKFILVGHDWGGAIGYEVTCLGKSFYPKLRDSGHMAEITQLWNRTFAESCTT